MAKYLSEEGLRYFYNQLKSKFAAASHNHSASNITSGTLPITRGGTGQTTAAGVRNALGLGNTTGAVPVANGGTGANTVAAAVKALLGSSSIGSSTKPLYYDGAALKACADSIGGGGIVAQLLEQNGYVKFANGLILQWGVASTSSYWTTENKYPVSFNLATFAISLLPRDPNANYTYSDQVGLQKCTKTGFYGGLAHTIEPDNIFYIVVGI